MQNVKNQSRIWSWLLALTISSTLVIACNNEAKPAEEPKTDTPAVAPAAPATKDSLPPVDPNATTRPDGKPTGGQ